MKDLLGGHKLDVNSHILRVMLILGISGVADSDPPFIYKTLRVYLAKAEFKP